MITNRAMYQLTIIFGIFISVAAKIINYNDNNYDNELSSDSNFGFDNHKRLVTVTRRPLWILNIKDDWRSPQLRLGTEEESIEFNYYAYPLIRKRVKKDNPDNFKQIRQTIEDQNESQYENINLQKEILKAINKFALSTNIEPDAYLSETGDENEPSIELYFKGDYTTLVVNCDNKMWRYFINPPSPLPAWFYTIHDTNSATIQVPENVKNKFYKSLLRMLQMYFSFPV